MPPASLPLPEAGGRTAVTHSVGTLGYLLRRFATFDAIAAIVWALSASLLGYFGGAAFEGAAWKGWCWPGIAFGLASAVEGRALGDQPAQSRPQRGIMTCTAQLPLVNYPPQVAELPIRYRSSDEDSARWIGFPFRTGDIVISTRSKTGTTWVQMICALLIFQTPDLPASLGWISPWLDFLTTPREEVYGLLEAQVHRRFIKTHTPLDGIPLDSRVTYIVTRKASARYGRFAVPPGRQHRSGANAAADRAAGACWPASAAQAIARLAAGLDQRGRRSA